MAFTGQFTVTQNSNIQNFLITDTSDYGDEGTGTFAGRTISIYKADGTLLVPEINFPFISGNTYTVSGQLLQDYSLSIVFNWESNDPQPGSTYEATEVVTFLNYTKQFLYEKVQDIAAQPTILNDTNFYNSLRKVQSEVANAENATTYADQFSAQGAIDRAGNLILNEQFYF